MKILFINKFFYRRGGAEAYFLDLAKFLESQGHEVAYFSMHHKRNPESKWSKYFVSEVDYTRRQGLVSEFKKAGRFMYSYEAKRKLKKLLNDFKPDLVHLHNVYHQLTSSILDELRDYPAPKVMTLHDYKLICPNYKLYTQGKVCERCFKHKYYEAVFHKCLQDSYAASGLAALEMYWTKSRQIYENVIDCFVSPSQFLADKIKDWGVRYKRLEHVPNFVGLDEFSPNYEAGDYYVYAGRLSQEKGLADLIGVFRELPNAKVKIVGTGPMEENLKQLVKVQNINNIEFLGYKQKEELFEIIRNCRAVVVPSVWLDNYPYSVLEAQALGKAVIGSKRGGIGEMVLHEQNGYLYEPESQNDLKAMIIEAEKNIAHLPEFGRMGRARVARENDPKKHLDKIISIYESLLKRP